MNTYSRHLKELDEFDTSEALCRTILDIELEEKTATYLQPIIMNPTNSWRVAHSFIIHEDDGTEKMVQVLPENILEIHRLNEPS